MLGYKKLKFVQKLFYSQKKSPNPLQVLDEDNLKP